MQQCLSLITTERSVGISQHESDRGEEVGLSRAIASYEQVESVRESGRGFCVIGFEPLDLHSLVSPAAGSAGGGRGRTLRDW